METSHEIDDRHRRYDDAMHFALTRQPIIIVHRRIFSMRNPPSLDLPRMTDRVQPERGGWSKDKTERFIAETRVALRRETLTAPERTLLEADLEGAGAYLRYLDLTRQYGDPARDLIEQETAAPKP
jgi:hypothetical protein